MIILIVGLVAAGTLLLMPRFLGGRQERVSKQYHVLEKRFGLSRRVTQSRWGKGIGERFSLAGGSRGYPLSLYDHYVGKGKERMIWTSLVFEVLFADDLGLSIEFTGTQEGAKFDLDPRVDFSREEGGVCIRTSDSAYLALFDDEALCARFAAIERKESCGAIRLSKGFLEYRELGLMEQEEMRVRFQETILLLAHFCDALSLFVSERRRGGQLTEV